ncbi:hypothetical protein [Nonomuraea longicatena]|uniref:Integral membrane protein n=1 Tax=Nonomuraea longicatena TaxID=83682 RepID=A0ABP4BL32_9ACTN
MAGRQASPSPTRADPERTAEPLQRIPAGRRRVFSAILPLALAVSATVLALPLVGAAHYTTFAFVLTGVWFTALAVLLRPGRGGEREVREPAWDEPPEHDAGH